MRFSKHSWQSPIFFIASASGAAIGFSNIWLLPNHIINNGGLVFIALYIICLLFIVLPIFISEVSIGFFGKGHFVGNLAVLAQHSQRSNKWKWIGYASLLAAILLFINFSLVGSWPLYYIWNFLDGSIQSLNTVQAQHIFTQLIDNQNYRTASFSILLLLVAILLSLRIKVGIGYFSLVALPILIIALVIILFSSYTNVQGSLIDYWRFDFKYFRLQTLLLALNHAFFTLLIGVGAMSVYGSYLSSNADIFRNCLAVVAIDVFVALLSTVAITPLALALDDGSTTSMAFAFVQLPVVFSQIYGGQFLGLLFFVALLLTALTTLIALLEPFVNFIERTGLDRRIVAPLVCIAMWLLIWIFFIANGEGYTRVVYWGLSLYEILLIATRNILLPIISCAICIFIGYFVSMDRLRQILSFEKELWFQWWYLLVRTLSICACMVFLFYTFSEWLL